jgi:hypothetical protein
MTIESAISVNFLSRLGVTHAYIILVVLITNIITIIIIMCTILKCNSPLGAMAAAMDKEDNLVTIENMTSQLIYKPRWW